MTVRVYRSSDFGAPVLTGQVGTLSDLLEKCLVTGYGTLSVTSLTQAAGVATATTVSPHGYLNKPKVLLSGANEAGYNIEVTATITGPYTFTFPVDSGTASPATGSVSVKRNGSGWTTFTGTTIKVLRQPTSGANGFYLRIEDAASANVARFTGYETMTDANNGTNPFPSVAQQAGGLYVFKSGTTDTVARPWWLVCNGGIFYLLINQASAVDWTTSQAFGFGDFASYKSGDTFNTFLAAGQSSSVNSTAFNTVLIASALTSALGGHFIARTHTGLGTSIACGKHSDIAKTSSLGAIGSGGMAYPHPVDGGLYVSPLWLTESTAAVVRGVLPGMWAPLHNKPLATGDVWEPTGELSGKVFEAINSFSASQMFFEISDTW